MSAPDLPGIRARLAAVAPGPWVADLDGWDSTVSDATGGPWVASMTAMSACEVLAALRVHHSTAALVSEVTILDAAGMESHSPDTPRPMTRRIDALMFQNLIRTAIEIKVDVADVKRESWQKVQPWWRVCHRFVYAVPAGLIDFPPIHGTGLWWVHEDGRVEVKRKARVSHTPEPLPQRVVQNLAYRSLGKSTIVEATS